MHTSQSLIASHLLFTNPSASKSSFVDCPQLRPITLRSATHNFTFVEYSSSFPAPLQRNRSFSRLADCACFLLTMSPRRSSRARSSQQPPAPSQGNSSSSSSTTTLKESRNGRTSANNNRSVSPRTASVQRSESVDDADSMARSDQAAPRRSRRGADVERDSIVKQQSVEDEENDAIEDDITRCICGHAEYPGPSASIKEQYSSTSTSSQELLVISWTLLTCPTALSDDIGNFFVQCDNCHVWQHGGCMGLNDESIIPDEYYCEKCRPDFHRIIKGSNVYVLHPIHCLSLVTAPRVLVANRNLIQLILLTF